MGRCNCVRFADDGNDGGFALERAQHLNIEILVQCANQTEGIIELRMWMLLLAQVCLIRIKTDRVEDEEDTVNVGIAHARSPDNLLLFGESLLKL